MPRSASSSAVARPMPVEAPVTSTFMNRDTTRVLFAELAAATEDVRGVSGRLAKVERLAAALRELAPEERVAGASYLAGTPRQRVLGVGWASLRDDPPPPASEPTLTVADVDAALAARGGDERRGLGRGAPGAL